MVSSGQATVARPTQAASSSQRIVRARLSTKLARVVAACCVGALVLGGCAAGKMTMGKPPPVERLSQLTVGVSTGKDVVALFGEPQGRGATRSQTYGLQDAWLYESSETEGTRAHMRMLMVFLDKETGVYHGYMWVGYGMLLGQTK